MHLGAYSFILQAYYVEQWANSFVFHLRVSDVNLWSDHLHHPVPTGSAASSGSSPPPPRWALSHPYPARALRRRQVRCRPPPPRPRRFFQITARYGSGSMVPGKHYDNAFLRPFEGGPIVTSAASSPLSESGPDTRLFEQGEED